MFSPFVRYMAIYRKKHPPTCYSRGIRMSIKLYQFKEISPADRKE